MNIVPSSGGMAQPMMPQMPSEDQMEMAQEIAEACSWEEISGVLRSDDRRNYQIDIATDVTAFEDEEAEKTQAVEFIKAITEMMVAWAPMLQMNASIAPFVKELATFAASKFKAGRTFEEALGDAFDQIKNMPPQPDPEMEKIRGEMEMAREKHAMEMDAKKADIAGKQQTAQIQDEGKQADMAAKQQSSAMDMQAKQADIAIKERMAAMEMQIEQMRMEIERQKLGLEREKMSMDMAAKQEEHALNRETMYAEHEMQREQNSMDREQAQFEHGMARQEAQDRRAEKKQEFKDKQAMAKSQAASKAKSA